LTQLIASIGYIFNTIDSVNWLEMHTCGDLFTDCLLENDIDDEIDSLSPDSFYPPSFATPDRAIGVETFA